MERMPIHPARRTAIALLLAAIVAAMPLPAGPPALAAVTFTVNRVADAPDADPADGKCDADRAKAGNQCTLRAAIEQANASPGRNTIRFDIPGGGVKTIRPASKLPPITQSVIVDGYTQPGAKPNTAATGTNAALRVELDGSNAGPAVGLDFQAPKSTVRGLVVNRFISNIMIRVGGGSRIEGCFLGTDPAGTAARDADSRGAQLLSANNVVGGTSPAARNLISGNKISGIDVFGSGNRIEGNLVGTASDGVSPLANGISGITVSGSDITVGGTTAAAANVIAFNGDDGVFLPSGAGNRILRNSIFANAGEGIDLGGNGPTPNDRGDGDTGPNNFQNTPVLTSAATAGAATIVEGRLNSSPNRTFVVRLFSNPSGDEGQVFRGQLNVRTNAQGNATFTFSPSAAIPPGHTVTATATDPKGNTSEFSAPEVV